jgi:hypothetical protein
MMRTGGCDTNLWQNLWYMSMSAHSTSSQKQTGWCEYQRANQCHDLKNPEPMMPTGG